MSTGTGRSVNAHILLLPLSYAEVAQGILLGPSAIHAVGLGPTLLFLAGWRVTPVGAEVCSGITSRETPSLGPQHCAEPGKGKGHKKILALLCPQSKRVGGCQGLCSREKKDSVHGSCVTPSCWAGSQACQHLMGQHTKKGFLLLTFSRGAL